MNVLEHVPDWQALIVATMSNLLPGSEFRAVCPNYSWPYEPHFHMPTLFSKAATARVLKNRISMSAIETPWDFWEDLSWPTGRRLKAGATKNGLGVHFVHDATLAYINRVKSDPTFVARKGAREGRTIEMMLPVVSLAFSKLPAHALPVLDCTFNSMDSMCVRPS